MAKNITKNYIYNLCYQVLTLLTPLITTPYISRVLGADGIGTVSYVESVVSYFVMFASMGIQAYGQREISYVQDSIEKRSIVFWNAKLLSFVTSGVALVLYISLSLCQDNSQIYLIFALNILTVTADIVWFFQGLEEFGKIALRNVILRIANIVYVFLVVRSAADLELYALGQTIFLFLSNVLLWGMLPGYVQKVKLQELRPFKDIRVVISLFIPTIATQAYTVLGKIMIGTITRNSFENGYYEQALKISTMVLTLVTAFGAVMIPRIGYFFEKKDMDEVHRLIYKNYRFVWFLGIPLCFGLIIVSGNFVPWFFGSGYEKVSYLLHILAFLILVTGISNVTGMQYLVPTKRQNILSQSVILGACTNFTMNLFLVKPYGSIGAAVASVIAELVVTTSQLYFVRKELSLIRVFKEGVPYYIAGAVMSISLYFLATVLSPSIIHTAILVACGAWVYFAALTILRDDFFLSNAKNLFGKFIKNMSPNQ